MHIVRLLLIVNVVAVRKINTGTYFPPKFSHFLILRGELKLKLLICY